MEFGCLPFGTMGVLTSSSVVMIICFVFMPMVVQKWMEFMLGDMKLSYYDMGATHHLANNRDWF